MADGVVDALSFMVQSVRLRATCYASVRLHPPWGVGIPPADAAAFHAVMSGRCWFRLDDGGPIELAPGDVVVLPHGHRHAFFDDPTSPIRVLAPITPEAGPPAAPRQRLDPDGSGPDTTTVISGHLWFDDRMANPLIDMLPPLLLFHPGSDARPASWLEPVLRLLVAEQQAPTSGTAAILVRLSEVIVIHAIRAHLDELPADGRGWLHALADPQLGAALGLIHQYPQIAWTVAGLASRVGLSRSTFAARFTTVVGRAPLQYLTYWRMQHAQRLLRGTDTPIAQIAAQVGYQTAPSFSRAMKQWAGITPGAYRHGQ